MDKLLEILRKMKPEVDFENSTGLVDEGVFDSLDIVNLVASLEEEFQITIDSDAIDPDNFQSASAILEMINKIM